MTNTLTRSRRHLTIGLAALALAGTGSTLTATVAHAAPVNTANVDPDATYSLNIHKYLGAPTGAANDGTVQTVNLPPLSGVAYDVYQVQGIDMTTNSGQQTAQDLSGHTVTAAEIAAGQITGTSGQTYTISKVQTVTTGSDGTATYGKAGDAGLYVTAENLKESTSIVNTVTGKSVDATSVTPSVPFLVALPETDPATGSGWMPAVDVYPKNTSDQVVKAVVDAGTVTKDNSGNESGTAANTTITYPILTSITPGMSGTQMGSYAVIDPLDARLTYTSIKQVDLVNTAGDTTATLTAGTDYQVYVNKTLNGAGKGGDTVQVVMTASGRDKLAAAKAADDGAQVRTQVVTSADSEGDGTIPNDAWFVPNTTFWDAQTGTTGTNTPYNPTSDNPVGGDTPGIHSNTVVSKYGDVKITKTDQATKATLSGAVFSLFEAPSTSWNGTQMAPSVADCQKVTGDPGKAIMTGITTGSDGTATVKGLQQSDFINNAQVASGGTFEGYCLVETKAPAGYELAATPIAFAVNQAEAAGVVPVAVADTKENRLLPSTGGSGAGGGLWVGGGLLAAAAGVGGVMWVRRRRNDDKVGAAGSDRM